MQKALDRQILEYLPMLGKEEKESLIGVIKSFLHLKENATAQISIEQYNKELQEAEAEFEKGEYISNKEMLKQIKKW